MDADCLTLQPRRSERTLAPGQWEGCDLYDHGQNPNRAQSGYFKSCKNAVHLSELFQHDGIFT